MPRAPTKPRSATRVATLLDLIQLSGLEKRYPTQLSGGQRQRVALARALAVDPRVLLLDEPFGALDAKVRKELRRWLREIHDQTGHTTVFVTHDQEEALELADRVVVMNDGRIEQVGTADEIFDRPATPFVFDFIGDSSALPVTVENGHVYLDDRALALDAQGGSRWTGHVVFPAEPDQSRDRRRRKAARSSVSLSVPGASAISGVLSLKPDWRGTGSRSMFPSIAKRAAEVEAIPEPPGASHSGCRNGGCSRKREAKFGPLPLEVCTRGWQPFGLGSARRFAVDALAHCDGGELLVRRLLLVQVGRQQPDDVVAAERFRPGNQRAVARDLVVLDRLRCADDGGIEHFLVGDFAGDFVGFANEAVDRGAFHALRLLAELLEDLVEPRDLVLGFFEMVLQALR